MAHSLFWVIIFVCLMVLSVFATGCTREGEYVPQQTMSARALSEECINGVVYYAAYTHAGNYVFTAKFLPDGRVAVCP